MFNSTRTIPEVTKECEIKGKRMSYDACSSRSLKEAKEFYGDAFKYIGSSRILILNGRRDRWEKMHHFFVRKDK